MAELKVKVSADPSAFNRGMSEVQRIAAQTATGIKSTFKAVGAAVGTGVAAGAAGAAIGATFLANGVKGALDAAGAMSDLSEQTGVSVRNLVILQKRFTDAGLTAEDAGTAINKMQSYLESIKDDSGKQGLLRDLGVGIADIFSQDPAKQFETLARAVSGLGTAGEKTAAARTLFGKGGAKGLGVLAGDLFADVPEQIAREADRMQKNAAMFDRVGDKLGGPSGVLKSFYTGLAESVVPALEKVIDQLVKLDLAEQGKKFGEAIISAGEKLITAVSAVKGFAERTVGEDGLAGIAGRVSEYVTSEKYKDIDFSKIAPGLQKEIAFVAREVMRETAGVRAVAASAKGVGESIGLEFLKGMAGALTPAAMILRNLRSETVTRPAFGGEEEAVSSRPNTRRARRSAAALMAYRGAFASPYDPQAMRGGFDSPTMYDAPDAVNPGDAFGGIGAFGTRRSREFYKRMNPGGVDFQAALRSRVGSSLNIDTAEAARNRRRSLFEDAQYTNPLASGAQLNGIVNQQMQEERDKKRADKLRESINEKRRARGEEELKAPKTAAEENAAAIAKALEPLYKQQTTDIQSTVAR